MFNNKRIKHIEYLLNINQENSEFQDNLDFEFNYKYMFRGLLTKVNNLQAQVNTLEKELAELKEFLGIETYQPDCKPYLRKKPTKE
jgi:hypothetical protein